MQNLPWIVTFSPLPGDTVKLIFLFTIDAVKNEPLFIAVEKTVTLSPLVLNLKLTVLLAASPMVTVDELLKPL